MFRWKYLAPALVVVALLAAIPTAYSARWYYCKEHGDYSESRWGNAIPTYSDPPEWMSKWYEQEPDDIKVATRWAVSISPLFAEIEDSWHGLTEDEQRLQEDRFWSNRPENIYRGPLWMTINPATAGTTYQNINFALGSAMLVGGAISSDEQWLVESCRAENGLTSVYFRRAGPANENSIDQSYNFFDLICDWRQDFEFEGVNYRVWTSSPLHHPVDWTIQKKFFVSESEFKRLALETLDQMESEIVQFVESNRPQEGSYKIHVRVDVVKCTCRTIKEEPNRPLAPAEKEQILQEARKEINRRRELIKTHGQVWFETLDKILIPLE